MGTIHNQPERDHQRVTAADLDDFLGSAVKLAAKHKIAVSDVLAAKQALEAERRNDLYVVNGDVIDEQMSGIGMILEGISSAVEGLKVEG
jgi:hypothetical protein